MNTTLGERIRELREEKDISLRELAAKLSLSAAFVSDIELGRRYPSDKVLAAIANALSTKAEELEKYDTRAPVEGLKKLAATNPTYGLAFRIIVEKKIDANELLRWTEKRAKEEGGEKR